MCFLVFFAIVVVVSVVLIDSIVIADGTTQWVQLLWAVQVPLRRCATGEEGVARADAKCLGVSGGGALVFKVI